MGGVTIPLAANGLKLPEQPDTLGQYGKAVALQGLLANQKYQQQEHQLQMQQQQLAIAKQKQQEGEQLTLQTLTPQHVVKDESGKVTGYDWNGLFTDAASKGVSLPTLNTLRTNVQAQEKEAQAMDQQTFDLQQKKLGAAFNAIEGVRGVQDPLLRKSAYLKGLATLRDSGQDISQFGSEPPDDAKLSEFESSLGMGAQILSSRESAAKLAQTQAATKASLAQAENAAKNKSDAQLAYEASGTGPEAEQARKAVEIRNRQMALGRASAGAVTLVVPQPDGSGKVVRVGPGSTVPEGSVTPADYSKTGKLTPATQTLLQTTDPVKQQVDQLITALTPYKDSGRMTFDRLKYALGEDSPEGSLASEISKLELTRVVAGARILKGSSRAYQALELAMKHAPNPMIDTPALMLQKLKNIQTNLNDIEADALKFGAKGQTVGDASRKLGGAESSVGIEVVRDSKGRIVGIK